MPDRSAIAQVVQVRKETTQGVDPTTGTKRLQALGIELNPKANFDTFRPMGSKWPALSPEGKEWAEGALSGRATYTELVYPLASVITAPVITTPVGGTTSRDHTFTLSTTAPDSPVTFTVEQGDANFAELATGGIITDFNININRDSIELGGTMMFRALQTGITLAGSPGSIALIPVLPKEVSVYLDPTGAGLGTTQLLRAFHVNVQIQKRFGAVWPLDASQTSYATTVETEPDSGVELEMQADAAGNALISAMRADTIKFLRVEAIGSVIETTIHYKMRLDMALKVAGEPKYGDTDGDKTITFPLKLHDNPTWGQAFQAVVTNTIVSL